MEKCGTVVPQSNFQKRVIRQRIDCNTQISFVIESSKGKETAATQIARRHLFKELLYDTMGKLRTPHPPPGLFGLPPAPPAGGKITLQYHAHRSTD